MDTGLIAKRYATALADFATERGEERAVFDEARRLALCLAEAQPVRTVLLAPTIDDDAKMELIAKCLDGHVSESMERFVRLVFAHRRERNLEFMLHSLVRIVKQRNAVVDVELVTAAPLDPQTQERIAALAKQLTHSVAAEMSCRVDEKLIGGFRLRMDDRMIDASIRTQLDEVRRQMVGNNKRIL